MKNLIFTAIFFLLPAIGLAKGAIEPPFQIEAFQTGIEDQDTDEANRKLCKALKMDEKALRSFLKKAVVISGQAWQAEYSWLPCYARANLIKDGKTIKVKVWAGITGILTYPDEKWVFIADPSKRDKPNH